jgi:hypothetical protein
MKTTLQIVAILMVALLPMGVMGQVTIASDNVSNYSSNWTNGNNGGFGFNAWNNTYGANTGSFNGNPSNNGMGTSGIGTNAFGMFATGTEYLNARRVFNSAMGVGDVLTFYWAMNWDAGAGGAKGFDLKAGGTTVFNINNGGSEVISSTNGTADGSYGTNPMLVTLTRSSSSEYSFTMTRRSDGTTFSTSISSSQAVDRLEFYIGGQNEGNGNRNVYFNHINLTSTSASTSIANAAGWRMLSSPVSTTYANLLGPVWTQGATGSDAPSNGDPNVITYTDAGGFADVTDLTTTIPAGQGFIYQHFNDDDYDDTPNASATTLSVTGTEHPSGTTFTPSWADGTEYAVAGNPFATTIDWDLVGKGAGVSAVVWVYDRNISDYINWNGTTGDLTDGLIAPFQGFWIEYTSAASTLTFETADKSTGGTFYRKEVQPYAIALEGASGSYKSTAFVEFEESGSLDKGPKDALKFVSLSPSNLSLSTVLDGKAYSINHLPMLDDELMLPLDIQFTEGGVAELSVASLNLPEGWVASLHDKVSGETYALTGDFRMDVALPALKSAPRNPLDGNGQPMVMAAASDPRFTLIVDPLGTTSTENGKQTTENFRLEQNYPNPFNPSTVVGFQLSVAGKASLKVYDMLGREVAVLVNGTMPAGSHTATFDASHLTSGVYVYKLEAGGQVMTKRMTLVK